MTDEERAAVKLVAAIAEAIRDLGQVPSGHLYAHLQGSPLINIDSYRQIIEVLKKTGMIRVDSSHLITWIGPREETPPWLK